MSPDRESNFSFPPTLSRDWESDPEPHSYQECVLPLNYLGMLWRAVLPARQCQSWQAGRELPGLGCRDQDSNLGSHKACDLQSHLVDRLSIPAITLILSEVMA